MFSLQIVVVKAEIPVYQIFAFDESEGFPEGVAEVVCLISDKRDFQDAFFPERVQGSAYHGFSDALPAAVLTDRRMVDVAPTAVMAAQDRAGDRAFFFGDEACKGIAL